MKLRIRAITTIVLLTAALLSSCIKEGPTECPPPRVVVKLAAEMAGASPLPEYDIAKVWVYVFDGEGRCTAVWEGGRYTSGREYAVSVTLPEGSCTLVAWTNLHEDVFGVSHRERQVAPAAPELIGTHIDQIGLFRNMPAGARVTFNVPDLLHGQVRAEVAYTPEPQTIVIPIRPLTYRVTYLVTGLPETFDDYRFTAGDSEFRFRFDGTLIHDDDSREFFYDRTVRFTDGGERGPVLTASMTMVGLSDDDGRIPPTFSFRDATTGTQYYPADGGTADLIDMIVRSYRAQHGGASPDFGREFEFLVPLRFTTGLGVELDLRPWYYLGDEWIME